MQQNLPFNFKEVFKLSNLGLNPELFKFGHVTFESQKYICVKDQAVRSKQVISFSNSPKNNSFRPLNYTKGQLHPFDFGFNFIKIFGLDIGERDY